MAGKSNHARIIVVAAILAFMAIVNAQAKNTFAYRYVRVSCNGSNSSMIADIKDVISRAAAAGYNGVAYDDPKIRLLGSGKLGPSTIGNMRSVAQHVRSKNMVLIPMAFGQLTPTIFGIDNAEAFPVVGTQFVVNGNTAKVVSDHPVVLKNGEFEGEDGWRLNDGIKIGPGRIGQGLMAESPTRRTIAQQGIKLKRNRAYEFKVWIKTQDYNRAGEIGIRVYSWEDGIYLLNRIYGGFSTYESQWGGRVNKTQNWRQYTVDFNTIDKENVEIRVEFAVKGGGTGTAWLDGLELREVGLRETVRRSTMPVIVKSKSGVTYTEKKDYNVGRDQLTIPAGSAIKNGDTLKVNWGQRADMVGPTPVSSMHHQETWTAMAKLADTLNGVFEKPDGWFVKYSEWRTGFWDPAAQSAYDNSLPKYMGGVQYKTNDMLRATSKNCNTQLLLWNDSFDPHHNSVKGRYYQLNGTPYGNWNFLDPKTIIVNWNVHYRINSVLFFAGLDKTHKIDHPLKQILSIFNGNTTLSHGWLAKLDSAEARGLPDDAVVGIHYCTWGDNYYDGIEPFAQAAKATSRWLAGPVPMQPIATNCDLTNPAGIGQNVQKDAPAVGLRFAGSSLSYALSQNGQVQICLMDAMGRVVKSLVDGHKTAGSHSLKVDSSVLGKGIYFVSMKIDGQSGQMVRKIALM